MTKFYNPLFDTESDENAQVTMASKSSSKSQLSTSAAFNVESSDSCPKCKSATVPSKLISEEVVMFCTNCRVALAIPE